MPATLTTSVNRDTAPLDQDARARLELLESLPARLGAEDLRVVNDLHAGGKSPRQIARQLRLDELVVRIELAREASSGEEQISVLTRREWNRLAKGTHVPNQPLRVLIESTVSRDPALTTRSILRLAGIKDITHGDRLLGSRPYPGATRPSRTITCERAARLTRAAGHAPHEVPGL